MTDRIRQLTVVLDDDYRDDAEKLKSILTAIKMVKGVSKVTTEVVDGGDYIARSVVQSEIEGKIYEVIHEIFEGQRKGKSR